MDFYHENKEEVQAVGTAILAFQAFVFVTCAIAALSRGSSAALGIAIIGSLETLDLGLLAGTIALVIRFTN